LIINGNGGPSSSFPAANGIFQINWNISTNLVTSLNANGVATGTLTESELADCGFSNASNLVGFGPNESIIGTDIRDFTGDYGIRFTFDDATTGEEYVCEFGWFGGWGADLTNECVLASSPEPEPDTTAEDTERAISSFMLGRANQLASNQPRLIRFLRGEGCQSFAARGNDAGGSLEGCVAQGNIWSEVTAAWGNGSSYALGTIGAHQFLNQNLIVGGMVQFDRATDDSTNASGTGWMVGPYFAAKLPDQPLYFEGRLLYGQTDNRISPLGTYTDSFKTERWLAQLRAEGEIEHNAVIWIPLLDLTHTEDRSRGYTDSLGNAIGSQSVALTQATAGLDFRLPLQSDSGSLELIGGASAIYSATTGARAEFENGRGRVHMGVNWNSGRGAALRMGTFYDGIGTGYRSVGGNLGLDIRF
jgi:outer membrane autotransporter protein